MLLHSVRGVMELKKPMFTIAISRMTERLQHMDGASLLEEEQQVLAAQRDPKQFEPLYTKYFGRIAQFVYHRSGDKELSFDITSQVFYKALSNLSKYKHGTVPFSAWLFRVAVNELNDWFRKNKRQRVLNINGEGLQQLRYSMEDDQGASRDQQLFSALAELPAAELELVNMRYFEKRAFREIADMLQTGEAACKMKLYRILDKLKGMMKS